jgi:hypothetical protein
VHELASRESDADLGPVKITGADTTHDGLHVAFGRSISRPGTPDDEPGGPRGGGFPGFAGWQDFGGPHGRGSNHVSSSFTYRSSPITNR